MSSQLSSAPRRSLNERQAETVERLFAAATELLTEMGHEQMTIRLVADRAGVSPATAYTYFASKEHLFAELFWRLVDMPMEPLTGTTVRERLRQVTRVFTDLVVGSPALAAAANKSLLGTDPEVQRLRLQIGGLWTERFREALGDDADPDLIMTLLFTLSGAMLVAGIGAIDYAEMGGMLEKSVDLLTREC